MRIYPDRRRESRVINIIYIINIIPRRLEDYYNFKNKAITGLTKQHRQHRESDNTKEGLMSNGEIKVDGGLIIGKMSLQS